MERIRKADEKYDLMKAKDVQQRTAYREAYRATAPRFVFGAGDDAGAGRGAPPKPMIGGKKPRRNSGDEEKGPQMDDFNILQMSTPTLLQHGNESFSVEDRVGESTKKTHVLSQFNSAKPIKQKQQDEGRGRTLPKGPPKKRKK